LIVLFCCADVGVRGFQGSRKSLQAIARAFCLALLACLLLAGLQGCASRQTALWGAARSLIKPNEAVDTAPLQQNLRYLRVTLAGRAILMVLGYVDKDAFGRSVQVWYSAEGDVLRTQSGRLVGLKGGEVEWLNVRLPSDLPAWKSLVSEHRFLRRRDKMPGFNWNRVDHLMLQPVAPQSGTALKDVPATTLRWFEEVMYQSEDGALLPPARYALMQGADEPVYGEQCLSQTHCLSWQVWPPNLVQPTSTP
jgi:hypothetical protein